MSYKNTMKLTASNFALVWKQLLYLLICGFLFALSSYTLISPIINALKAAGVGRDLKNLFSVVYNSPNEFALEISEFIKLSFSTLIANFPTLYLNLIGSFVLCFFLPYLLSQMSILNLASILYKKFTMNMDVPYIQNGTSTLLQCLKFAFANILFGLPFWILIVVFVEFYIMAATTILTAIIGLVLLSMIILLLLSTKLTLFTYYTGNMAANNIGAFQSFAVSLIQTLKNFWKIMSTSIAIILTLVLINGFIAIFTFFAGLIITIPATFVFLSVYKVVTYLNYKGERYYLSNSVIFNPVKYQVTHDEYVNNFVPPEETEEIKVTNAKLKKKYKENKKETKQRKKKNK